MRDTRGKSETADGPESSLDRDETGRRDEALALRGLPGRLLGRRRRGGRRGPALERRRALDCEHQLEVEGVAAVARDNVRAKGPAEQRPIAEQVQGHPAEQRGAVAAPEQRAALAVPEPVPEC